VPPPLRLLLLPLPRAASPVLLVGVLVTVIGVSVVTVQVTVLVARVIRMRMGVLASVWRMQWLYRARVPHHAQRSPELPDHPLLLGVGKPVPYRSELASRTGRHVLPDHSAPPPAGHPSVTCMHASAAVPHIRGMTPAERWLGQA
jgi:hypothetical protein